MRIGLASLGFMVTALGAMACARPIVPQLPHVVLIVIDTLRADHLGAYGYGRATSPHLDEFARRGIRFARAHAASSWTAPSVASILTGHYPAVHGVDRSTSVLATGLPTMPEAFRAAGYRTAAYSANPAFVTPEMGFARGFDRFAVLQGEDVPANDPGDKVQADQSLKRFVRVAAARQVTDAVLADLDAHANETGPRFLYVHYFDPHAAYVPPPGYAERFGVAPGDLARADRQWKAMAGLKVPTEPDAVTRLMALYDGEIAFTDEQIGRLLDGLATRLRGPLVVAVTADHGEEFGEHGGMLHGRTLFEEQVRVPLLLAGGSIAAPAVVDAPVSLVGLWATLCEVAGLPLPTGIGPTLLGNAARPRRVFEDLEQAHPGLPPIVHRRAIVDGDRKLLQTPAGASVLFDLAGDSEERRPLPLGDADTSLVATLRERDGAAEVARQAAGSATTGLSAARRAQLEALGYAQ
ncbi:MAG: sulfatase [Candidatus Binatia bacterium]